MDGNSREKKAKQEMSNETRNAVLQFLLQRFKNGKIQHGAILAASEEYKVHRRTVSRLWQQAQFSKASGSLCFNVNSRKLGNCGRKRKDYSEKLENVKNVPLHKRGTIRSLSSAIDIPKTSLHRIFKEGKSIKRISSSIKPLLTEKNKIGRLRFCLQHVQSDGNFDAMFDHVHIDEKWFYITKASRNYYIGLDEPEPHRECKSKRFIGKVMFMAAVARPRWDSHKNQYFDGKIGVWPFVYTEPAKRNSKNRLKGVTVTKIVESVTKEEIKKMIIENVMPAIRQKFPVGSKSKPIYIQQDNAKPHLAIDDSGLLEEGQKEKWNLVLKCQPPNSPDLNVLDLGFFNAIQSLQHQLSTKTIDELIEAVQESFQNQSKEKLDNIFLTLQKCMESTMISGGCNSYKIVHINKEKLRRENRIPESTHCCAEAILKARQLIDITDNTPEVLNL